MEIYDIDPTNESLFEEYNKNIHKKYAFEKEEIIEAYLDAKKHKSNTKAHVDFEMNLDSNINKLLEELQTGTYTISTSTCFVVTLPKPREVFAADFKDRVVHHILIKPLMPKFEEKLIKNCFSSLPGRGTSLGVIRLSEAMSRHKSGYVYKFDMQNFFMSIRKDILKEILHKFIIRNCNNKEEQEKLLYLADLIVMHLPEEDCTIRCDKNRWKLLPKNKSLFYTDILCGLAIGNITSQLFANLYLNEFDHWMYSIFGDDYGRYVDDFFIVTDDKNLVKKLIPKIEKYLLEKLGLTLHKNKRYCQPVSHGCSFLGSVIKGERIYVGNGTVSNLHEVVHKLNLVDKKKYKNLVDCIRSLNSYLGFMAYDDAYDIIKRELSRLDPSWYDYVYIISEPLTEKDIAKGKRSRVKVQLRPEYKILNNL